MCKKELFGDMVLALFQIVDGYSLVYGYSNRAKPSGLDRFQAIFRQSLINYLNNQNSISKTILDIIVSKYENIVTHNVRYDDLILEIEKVFDSKS